jgi:predicted dithiol-disulfide oxidoreductase (DUF899 family)
MAKPMIVSAEEWQHEPDELLRAEKEATRAIDELAARRRRLPMVKFSKDYRFGTPAPTPPWTTRFSTGSTRSLQPVPMPAPTTWPTHRRPSPA